jgi:hypothetical protein
MRTSIPAVLLTALLMQPAAFAASSETTMQQNMQEMQTLMAQIKEEQDPAKLEALMQQHRELMREGMGMMREGMGMMGRNGEPAAGMTMERRMEGMEGRMEMMQMMMGQMMEHDNAEAERPVHQHKR